MTEKEKKAIAKKTKKAIADTKKEMQEDGYIGITGVELEALVISASAGDLKAQEAIDLLTQAKEGKDVIKTTTDYLLLQEDLNALLEENKKPIKADPKALQEVLKKIESLRQKPVIEVLAKRPKQFLAPTDKVSNRAFEGLLNSAELLPVAMESKKSKKHVTNMVSINFDEAQTHGLSIKGRKELTPYDRVIHDAITTLYIDGENEIVTTNMIYQTITGNTGHATGVTAKASQAISESVTKLMYSRLILDASAEEDAFFNGVHLSKDSPLLPAERLTASINGQIQEAIHILKAPPLYEYANLTKRIGRVDMKLLNTPINKNEEIIMLQDYLMRRVLSIKNPNNKLSPSIVYDTVYKQLEIEAPTQGALRKKKATIRKYIKKILDYWKDEDFIKGYVENKRKNEMYSVTIRY